MAQTVTVHKQEPGSQQPPAPTEWWYWGCQCGQCSDIHDDFAQCVAEAAYHKKTCGGTL